MRVLIIALDALEYDLVEKFDFENLKQIEYGKVSLGDMCPEIATYMIWPSFFTGVPPSVHKIKEYKRWNNPSLRS